MRMVLCIFVLGLAGPAKADLFSAAGRIEDGTARAICSASLISPDVIVTAAHCVSEDTELVYYFRSGAKPDVSPIRVERMVRHPLFDEFGEYRRLRFDIAVGSLEQPVNDAEITPLTLGDDAASGEGLFVVSWPQGSGTRPRQRRCVVIDGVVIGVVTLGCRVRGGESGAPLVRLTDGGIELVAIINSTANQRGQSVALASNIRLRIPPLLDRLKASP